jgi:hypothetical protein
VARRRRSSPPTAARSNTIFQHPPREVTPPHVLAELSRMPTLQAVSGPHQAARGIVMATGARPASVVQDMDCWLVGPPPQFVSEDLLRGIRYTSKSHRRGPLTVSHDVEMPVENGLSAVPRCRMLLGSGPAAVRLAVAT